MAQPRKKIIMVFGTFDTLHKGHLNFFKQARALAKNPFLIVSVAQNINVKKIKGHKPLFSTAQRLAAVKKRPEVDRAVLGGAAEHLSHIVKERPEIIALGYDQKAYTRHLKKDLAAKGLIVSIRRLRAFLPRTYKSSLLKKAR